MHTSAYKGEGGLNMTKNTHFVHRLIENESDINKPIEIVMMSVIRSFVAISKIFAMI